WGAARAARGVVASPSRAGGVTPARSRALAGQARLPARRRIRCSGRPLRGGRWAQWARGPHQSVQGCLAH
ncbi:hypothetical protein T484DRAFT_1905421, partial [Baffinella frigidus]